MSAVTPGTGLAESDAERGELGAVVVREIDQMADLSAAVALLNRIWGMPDGLSVVSTGVLRAWAFTGNYVAAAYLHGEMVGVSTGFLGVASSGSAPMLHSHVTGVRQGLRGHRVGSRMKRHQRAWAITRGIEEITWTFDPAIRRNARFNLVKLGAEPVAYLPDFYGRLDDELNAGSPTDRLLVSWPVRAPEPAGAAAAVAAGDAFRLLEERDGHPVLHTTHASPAHQLVALPDDIEALRVSEPALALEWRLALRAALSARRGYRLIGLTADDHYLLLRDG